MRKTIFVSIIVFACSNTNGQSLKPDFKPEDLFTSLVQNPILQVKYGGEQFAWHAVNNADLFVKAYKVWKDTAWLNWGIQYYEFMLSRMHAGPDGYIGLIGPSYRENGLWNDEEISDALVGNILLEFSELVLNDASLKILYRGKAGEYVAFCKKQMIEKWDKRHQWLEIGEYGDYITSCDFVKPNDLSRWIIDEKIQSYPWMSLQYNKANCLGILNLRLYRITGDKFFRDKAEKLFFRMKSNFQIFDNHYVWNYWSPYYQKDILYDSNRCIHWVGVHPYRPGYQAWEVEQIVEAYHTGVVFDSTDIQRIINTNLNVMWNKSTAHPEFILSNGRHPDPSDKNEENAIAGTGTLWSALGEFSQTILDLNRREYEGGSASKDITERIQQAYFNNIVIKRTPGFKRKYAEGHPIIIKNVPAGNSPDLNYVGVIPYVFKRGQNVFVVAKSITSGNLTIDLYSRDGKAKIKTIDQGSIIGDGDGRKGFRMIKWNGTDPDKKMIFKGDYLVRWTLNDKYREYAIKIE